MGGYRNIAGMQTLAAIAGCLAAGTGCASSSYHTDPALSGRDSVDVAHAEGTHTAYVFRNSGLRSRVEPVDLALDGISRLELAELSEGMRDVAADPGLAGVVVVGTNTTDARLHEEAMGRAADKKGRDRIRNTFDVTPLPYTSVNDPLPAGWTRTADAIRHENSGMTCKLNFETEGDEFSMSLARVHQFDEAGMDVGCSFVASTSGVVTLFSSYWPRVSQNDHAANAAQNIKDRFNTVKSLPVPLVELADENGKVFEEPVAIGYKVAPGTDNPTDPTLKSSMWLVKTGGWHVKARATHLMEDKMTEIFAAVMFVTAHLEVRTKNEAAPIGGVEI